jgi:hypothetical protein
MNLQTAITQRNESMARVAAKANKGCPEWTNLAFAFLKLYTRNHAVFWPWEVREAFKDCVQPHDQRAWGIVYKKAINEGLIVKSTDPKDLRQDPTRHATWTMGWKCVRKD